MQREPEPLISIIVPVFNVACYLPECLSSLLVQDYKNLEIILVDDGSTDESGTICDSYAENYSNVVSIHKPNGGLSDARNWGLENSSGDIVAFVDSDDYISPVFISLLKSAMDNTGAAIASVSGGHSFRDGGKVDLIDSANAAELVLLDSESYLRGLLYQRYDTGAPFRIYRRECFDEKPFPVGLYYEDLASVYKFVHRAGSVALIDSNEYYAYRLRGSSIIRQNYSRLKLTSAIRVSRQLYEDITNWYPRLRAAACSRCFSVNRMVFAQIPSREKEDKKELWDEICKYRKTIILDGNARKRERVAAGVALFGQHAFSGFCNACRKIGLLQ